MNDAKRILMLLLRHQKNTNQGLCWTAKMIGEHTNITAERARTALQELVEAGSVKEHNGEYLVVAASVKEMDYTFFR